MRILDPDTRSPRDSTSQMAEGLFTSELGIQSDDSDGHHAVPTRTINLSEFQRRRHIVGNHEKRPPLQRRNAGIYLLPRVPDATVTANVVEIQINDGTGTSPAATVSAAAAETVVSLDDVGSVTVPGVPSVTSVIGTLITDSQSIITTPPPTPLPSDTFSTSSTDQSPAGSVLSNAINSTLTDSTAERTVTVTATSTFEVNYINGTVIATSHQGTSTLTASTRSGHQTSSGSSTASSSGPTGIGVTDSSSFPSPTTTFAGITTTPIPGSSTTSSGAAASSSDSSGSGASAGPGLTPQQQQVVGGVVGGVAGLAVVLLVLLVVLRWYRRRLKSRGELPEQIAARELPSGPLDPSMSQRSSAVPLTSQLASSLRRFRPVSSQTQATTMTASTVPESERGFQRIAGRKIAPVLGSGGDGYGGNYGAFEKETAAGPSHSRNERSLAGSSFYRDSGGFYGGKGTESPTYPPSPTTATTGAKSRHAAGPSISRDFARSPDDEPNPSQVSLPSKRPEGVAALRPSPARTPVTVSPASSIRLPIQQNPTVDDDAPPVPQLVVPPANDGIGRTLLREDGSRISTRSRSTGHGSRFAENI